MRGRGDDAAMTLRLARSLAVPATFSAAVIAVAGPLTWFILRTDDLRHEAEAYARVLAREVSESSEESPALWMYNTGKIAGSVGALYGRGTDRVVRVLDALGRTVYRAGDEAGPCVWAARPLTGAEPASGTVLVGLPALPVLGRGLLLLACFAALGAACGSFLFLVPLLSLRRAEEHRHLATRVFAAQEEERQRIARDLHDSAGQMLTAIRLNLEAAAGLLEQETERGTVARVLRETAALADGTIGSIRDLVHALDAPLFRPGGLETAVRQLAFQLGRSGCDLNVDAEGLAPAPLPRAAEVCAFRVVQEAVTNAVRHAAPCAIRVRLEGSRGGLRVTVSDDGPGVDAVREGHGLRAMRERITLLGGTLTVRSAAAAGFTVTAVLPPGPTAAGAGEEDEDG